MKRILTAFVAALALAGCGGTTSPGDIAKTVIASPEVRGASFDALCAIGKTAFNATPYAGPLTALVLDAALCSEANRDRLIAASGRAYPSEEAKAYDMLRATVFDSDAYQAESERVQRALLEGAG